MRRNLRESKNKSFYATNIIWNNEWTDYSSAIKQGRSSDFSMLPTPFEEIGIASKLFSDLDIYDIDNEDEIIERVSENLYERFFYYPDSFTLYDSDGNFIAEL